MLRFIYLLRMVRSDFFYPNFVAGLSGKRFSSEQALKRRFLSPFSFTQTKEQAAVSFQELRLCLRKNIPETFSLLFLVISSDRYALSRTISTLLNDHVMNHTNKYVFSFIHTEFANWNCSPVPINSWNLF